MDIVLYIKYNTVLFCVVFYSFLLGDPISSLTMATYVLAETGTCFYTCDKSCVTDSLRAEPSGDRFPVRARFSAPVPTGSGGQPASYTVGTGSFSGANRPGRGVNPPHLAPRLTKECSYTSAPPLGLRGLLWVTFTFTFMIKIVYRL